jgi:hypothetical protein
MLFAALPGGGGRARRQRTHPDVFAPPLDATRRFAADASPPALRRRRFAAGASPPTLVATGYTAD